MFFRFITTWILLALITSCVFANYQTGSSYVVEEQSSTYGQFIPFEKFVQGDVSEPLLYGQYLITENVSPFIPANYFYNLLSQNSYQYPVPMPPNFDVYKATNPTPTKYQPAAAPAYGPQSRPNSYSSHAAPLATASYSSPVVYSNPSPTQYQSAPAHSAKHDFSYGYNYENAFVPVSYHEPPHSPMTSPHIQKIDSKPAKPDNKPSQKPENKPPSKPDDKTPQKPDNKPADKPQTTEAQKPASDQTNTKPQTSAPSKPVSNDQPDSKQASADKPKQTEAKPNDTIKPKSLEPANSSKKSANKYTGYIFLKSPKTQPAIVDRRSYPPIYNNYRPLYSYRKVSPQFVPATSSNTRSVHVNQTVSNFDRRSNVEMKNYQNRSTKNSNSKDTNYQYIAPKTSYAAASTTSYTQASLIYNENNVAEALLRGYSHKPEENNNKAVIRIFEQGHCSLFFDMRFAKLTKNYIYSIYVHDYGQLMHGCHSAGGLYGDKDTYFNPILGVKSNPKGFIGSFKYTGEPTTIQHFTRNLCLYEIMGRNIVLHQIQPNPKMLPVSLEKNLLNNFSILLNPLSSPLVKSKRLACGIIGRANPYTFLKPPNKDCEVQIAVVNTDETMTEPKREIEDDENTELQFDKETSTNQTSTSN